MDASFQYSLEGNHGLRLYFPSQPPLLEISHPTLQPRTRGERHPVCKQVVQRCTLGLGYVFSCLAAALKTPRCLIRVSGPPIDEAWKVKAENEGLRRDHESLSSCGCWPSQLRVELTHSVMFAYLIAGVWLI